VNGGSTPGILLTTVVQAVKELTAQGSAVVVITNQSGIGLGLYHHEEVARLHDYLHAQLAAIGVQLTAVYYCPHHPSKGKCLCRKPGSLLLERAIARYDIDPTRSVMIGDRDRDVLAAQGAGVPGIRVEANAPLYEVLRENRILP
jgi:D-glycero-D-manno-heptose 1,7-bisphosphate phosphatase